MVSIVTPVSLVDAERLVPRAILGAGDVQAEDLPPAAGVDAVGGQGVHVHDQLPQPTRPMTRGSHSTARPGSGTMPARSTWSPCTARTPRCLASCAYRTGFLFRSGHTITNPFIIICRVFSRSA